MNDDIQFPVFIFDICVPVQEFRVDYTVVQKTNLPFVREFILRLLDLGSFTKDQVSRFMGFNVKEIDVALSHLLNLDEILINDGGQLELTKKSKQYFLGQYENRPKVDSLLELRNKFRFDLLTFSYVHSKHQLSHPKLSLHLKPELENLAFSIDIAKKAFQRNFHQIHDEERFNSIVINDPELYKISSFKKQNEKFLRFNQFCFIDSERNSLELNVKDSFIEKEEVSKALITQLKKASRSNNVSSISKCFDTFDFEMGVSSLKAGRLDLVEYRLASMKQRNSTQAFKSIIGSILLDDNWQLFIKNLDMYKASGKAKPPVRNELLWIAPSDSYWGKTELQLARFNELAQRSDIELEFWLPLQSRKDNRTKRELCNYFNSVQEFLCGFVDGFLAGITEVILLKGKFVFIFCYLYQDDNLLPIPVGFFTEEPNIVNGIESLFSSYRNELDEDFLSRDLGRLMKRGK